MSLVQSFVRTELGDGMLATLYIGLLQLSQRHLWWASASCPLVCVSDGMMFIDLLWSGQFPMGGRSRVWTSKLNYKAWHLLVELGEGASHTAVLVCCIRSGK